MPGGGQGVDNGLKSLRFAWILALGSLVMLPSVAADRFFESFEEDTLFSAPTGEEYVWSTLGTGTGSAFVSNAPGSEPELTGDKSLYAQPNNLVSPDLFGWGFNEQTGDEIDCSSGNDELRFNFYFTYSPVATGFYRIGIADSTSSTSGEYHYLRIGALTGSLRQVYRDTGGSEVNTNFDGNIGNNTWVEVVISCTTTTARILVLDLDGGIIGSNQANVALLAAKDRFWAYAAPDTATALESPWYVDNVDFNHGSDLVPGKIFCSDPSIEAGEEGSVDDFGYEYVEDWAYDDDLATEFGPTDGFIATESDGGSAYFGKGFDTGTKAIAVRFTIEAAVEGQDSVFRVAFTEGNGGTPSGATKGDGTDGGNFDDHVGLRFEEEGNDWRITFRENIGGAGYNPIGGSFTHGDPNTATSYNFTVDSRNLTARLLTGNGVQISSRTIDTSFLDELWEDQWFVATGTNAIIPSTTVLDDQTGEEETSDGSTCIYDLIGGAVASNTEGSDDQTTIPPPDEEPQTGAIESLSDSFEGFLPGDGAIMQAIFWILIFAAGAYGIFGEKVVGLVLGAVLGFFFSVFNDLIPDILVFLLVLVAAVLVGMRVFGSRGESEGS